MASRARVVLNLVGPYTLYGRPVIEACVAGGAHYADLTGEIPFVRQMIDAFADRAAQAGVKLVQVCGFESLPADLAVLLAAEAGPRSLGGGPRRGRPGGERRGAAGLAPSLGHDLGRNGAEPRRGGEHARTRRRSPTPRP